MSDKKNNTIAMCQKDGRLKLPMPIVRQLGLEFGQYYRFEITDERGRQFRLIKVT